MAKVGYARVSSYGQSLEVQLNKLADCDKIFQEKQSGRTADNREQLQACIEYLREGDVLCITKMDRLSRSLRDLLNMLNRLEKKGVQFQVLDQQIDTSTPSGRLLVQVLGSIGEFENDLRKDRQMQGIALAKTKGVQFGRKKAFTEDQVVELRELREQGMKITDLMAHYSVSKACVYRALTKDS